ncbi:hypothetical protein GCM10010992_01770 [Cloacibacterium rupense]|uniref:NlpC/P60 domain-containing protein n=1 Tax=Cloacibacterium rupense TaxID=517423 RepID=A0ABQ2NGG1_9FLAO|nr:C40 family peptidase [Cloacibacterium rupense]GGP01431.1 hypothetical protein GCM10010992_01770 [Cloacibacterium rupense]
MKQLKKIVYLVVLSGLLWSCGSSKPAYSKAPSKPSSSKTNLRNLTSSAYGNPSYKVKKILNDAEDYLGTPYRLGGTNKKGLDCSGLVITVFSENNYKLPRRSEDQAKEGQKIDIQQVKQGDLLFFATSGAAKVNHVGIVKDISSRGEVTFIHASTSKGVIISSLNDAYWNKAFLFARRVL